MSEAPVSQLKRDTSMKSNFPNVSVSHSTPLKRNTSIRAGSSLSNFSNSLSINYDIWSDVYSSYLKQMYNILLKFTRVKNEDTFTTVKKSKQTFSTKVESISFDSFCKFIYTHSSGYVTPYA